VGEIVRRVAPAHRVVLITDATVGPLPAKRVTDSFAQTVDELRIPAGEARRRARRGPS
jgi:hypothetical protein